MDEYDKKFAEMQKYIPFLEAMIERLQNVKDKSREIQLQKMQSLHGILSNSKRKLRIETLQRCEDVLQKLHNRVEKGNAPGLQLPMKQNDGISSLPSTSSEDAKSDQNMKMEQPSQSEDAGKDRFEETPASPDPSVSPDSGCQILPIIIPTERSTDFSEDKNNRQQTKIPVITLTENTRDLAISSSDSRYSDDVTFTEWDMLEESERHNAKARDDSWQSLVTSSDVATAAKFVSSNLPQKVNDGRNYPLGSRNIPTVPVPALGGSRRLSSVLEKNKLNFEIINVSPPRSESPVNVPDVRLKSPDPEILFPKPKVTSPRSKDNHNVPKTPTKPPMPLLVSPPPISTEPPLSMEDLAELLSDDSETEKKGEKGGNNAAKHKKDLTKQETSAMKDSRKNFLLSQSDTNKESEKRWEETIKLANRRCSSNVGTSSSAINAKIEPPKSNEIKGPPQGSSDHRSQQVTCMGSKFESRYEKHSRQRDIHGHENVKDKAGVSNNGLFRMLEEETSQIPFIYGMDSMERNVPLYQRRSNMPPEGRKDIAPSRAESEFRIDGTDYYNMHMNPMHWAPVQLSGTASDHQFGNTQWASSAYGGMTNAPPLQPSQHPYKHSMGMYLGTDSHPAEPQLRPNQFPSGSRPLLNPVARSIDNHVSRSENIREDIPPLMSSSIFSVAPQYRGFSMGQGSYDPAFDRPSEYSHMRGWEGENVITCGIGIVENTTGSSYPRSSTPWPRDRDRCSRGRGRDGYYNERNRMDIRSGFNRDMRRTDWLRDSHIDRENSGRFSRDNRNISDRDPRVRTEHNAPIMSQTKETSGSARDPRLAKDKHLASTKTKDITLNERDPRKRSVMPITPIKKINNKEKPKAQKSLEKRTDSESSCKEKTDKLSKVDRMQSPLESLYGVIDTKAKSSHGCGLQNFKIPKIKRPEPPPSPSSTTSHVTNDEIKEIGSTSFKSSRVKNDNKKNNDHLRSENLDKDDSVAEVSSSDDNHIENLNAQISMHSKQDDIAKEREILSSLVEETNKNNEIKIVEMYAAATDSVSSDMDKGRKDESDTDGTKAKEEVTQEWIEALIRKSFECGEGKKLVEHAKLIQRLGEALQAKKLKKIKKIIESESESSNSDKNDIVELKKTQTRKKRRVIVSDSSDDECLAERLEILNTSNYEKEESVSANAPNPKCSSEENAKIIASSNLSEVLAEGITTKENDSLENSNEKNIRVSSNSKNKNTQLEKSCKMADLPLETNRDDNDCSNEKNDDQLENNHEKENDRLENSNEKCDVPLESDKIVENQAEDSSKKKKQIRNKQDDVDRTCINESKDTDDTEQSLNQDKDQANCMESVTLDVADKCKINENSGDKPKPRTKRRNSLEMLQEDIREMFISEEVVSATGYRMCRLSKESQSLPGSAGTISSTSTPNSKKDEIVPHTSEKKSNVSERKVGTPIAEPASEISDESTVNNAKPKKVSRSRSTGEPNKSKTKNNKKDVQRVTRSSRSKETIQNSDNEENQPLALRTEWMSNSNVSDNTPNREVDRDDDLNDALRRSKRVLRKDSVKEPRVIIEKTDIAKIDSSKMMFDSSSDESFSIDVSELAAAVDISLRPEKQSDQESMDTNSKPRRKTVKGANKRNSKSKKNSFLTDDKSEDGMSFTDEESIISDISRTSSSTTAGKKGNDGAVRTTAKEELLSNILVGLVPMTEKNALLADKGDEADVDEDAHDPPTDVNTKKSSTKKKKKKCSWQMGIVKKKKRKNTSMTSKTSQVEETNIESNISTNSAENDPSMSVDNNVTVTEKVPEETENNHSAIDTNLDSLLKCEEIIKPFLDADTSENIADDTKLLDFTTLSESSDAAKETLLNESLLSIEEDKPILKTEQLESAEVAVTTQNTAEVSEKLPTIIYDERMKEIYHRMDIKRLMSYAWTGQDKYKCLLCFFVGKNIVHHYKMNHPRREILIARLKLTDAETAILDAENSVAVAPAETSVNQTCKYQCRFCCFSTEGAADVALEAFYEHCTTHTGEYRFHCKSCPYQAVAKASMKTHYYKMCRKLNDTFNESAIEDDIPKENGVYGYLCCECNYVQLKRQNVELHVAFWHRDNSNIRILKINMSVSVAAENTTTDDIKKSEEIIDAEKSFTEEIKPELSALEDIENKDVLVEMEPLLQTTVVTSVTESQDKDKENEIGEECCVLQEPKTEEDTNVEVKQETDDKSKTSQGEPETPMNTASNLSVFVCPPELENKEVEIQLERKKKMQEIANNIGIKLNKNPPKPGLSIIDKLQDKMRTDVVSTVIECNESINVSETKEIPSSPLTADLNKISESSKSEDAMMKERPLNQPTINQENPSSTESSQSNADKSTEMTNDNTDKAEIKIRDPLAIMDPSKDAESDGELSDNDTVRRSPVFESDSSSEQSDSEPADVNMILKETSSISASSSRDPMLTTIQRLAAQLQSAKPLEVHMSDDVKIKDEPISFIPQPPNVVPIANVKHLLAKQDAKNREMKLASRNDAGPPRNFIRFRRLSGDMLSIPAPLSDIQEDTRASSTDGTQSDSAIDIMQTDAEEKCSFLKIESVVSLAERRENDETENPIINDIRKAVEISPIKNKGISLIKKSSPLILKKVNVITQPLANANVQTAAVQPTTSETMTLIPVKSLPTSVSNFVPISPKPKIISLEPNKVTFSVSETPVANPVNTTKIVTVPSSSSSASLNYKIFKVVRTPALINHKDPPISSIIKMKTADAYTAMLKASKLAHFYKCMGNDCRFTSDSLILYYQHYYQHCKLSGRLHSMPPHDYQKCPYCYVILNDWSDMKNHMWEKHGHCRYQCGYCFYRAVVPSYIRQHQAISHPGSKCYFLMGKMGKRAPKQEDINRNDYILPYVCSHDCGQFFYVLETFAMHLTSKHLSSQSTLKCHICKFTVNTVELLISHYKSHGYSKYQCLYCVYGSDNPTEIHQHLSTYHCNRLPTILERVLPPVPSRSKNVIDQLILRIFDEYGKINEKAYESDADAANSKNDVSQVSTSALNVFAYPEPTNVEIALNQEKVHLLSSRPNILRKTDSSQNSNLNSAKINTKISHIASKQSKDASFTTTIINDDINTPTTSSLQKQPLPPLNKLNEKKPSLQSEKRKLSDYVTKQILHEPELELLSCINYSTVDPLEFSDEFNCSDEFVNTNLLDNPNILKSLTTNSTNALFFQDNTATSGDKTEDSDIEILETVGSTQTIDKKNKDIKVKDIVNQTIDMESSKQKTEKEEQPTVTRDIVETKHTSNETSANSNDVTTQPDELLTLEDIKHTGHTGVELYRCGYEECNFAAASAILLRVHVKECNFRANNKNLYCAHCKKRFIKMGFLLEHLKVHGLKRFGCSLCKMRYAVPYQATAHMKTKHKFPNTKLIPADPTNPSVDGLFIVQAIRFGGTEKKTKKRKGSKSAEQENEKTDNEKLSFSPDEIDQLPRQAIYLREVQCAVCPYTTKVRTNIIRHLQLHAKDETVPETGPVNPVPCLDKKERMFDKMVNLASSSHQNGRMGGKPKEIVKETNDDAIPKFVPEHKRYVCSVAECNYLTVDEAMLRYHLKALHSEEPYFRCPHCPQPTAGQESQNIAIDKMGVHLKMHDTRLYKCSHCNHHHYHRHVVERHLTDKHQEKRPFVKVIRELDNTENIQQTPQEEAEDEIPDPDGNHWKCNLCDFKCAYKAEMAGHAATAHDEKCQYKCTLCSFRTTGKILFEQHISSKHTSDPNVDYILVYQRIKGTNKRNTEIVEQSGQDEPFDTTPLWRRDMPRIRHIRGILLEEEDEVPVTEVSSTSSKVSLGKRKSEIELVTKPTKMKVVKTSGSDENKQSKEKTKRSLSCEKLPEETQDIRGTKENASKSDSRSVTGKLVRGSKTDVVELNDINESDMGRFGPYGKPDGNMYICTLCNQFKTKYKHDMRDHLYRELNYARWHCKACGYLSVNRNALVQHFAKHHNGERPDHEPLSPDNAIEDWVMTLLKKQAEMIRASQQTNAACKNVTSINTSSASPEVINAITAKTIQADKRTVDLSPAITNLQNDILRDANRSVDTDDGDSRDNEDLVIDMKEDEVFESRNNENLPENDKSPEKDEPEKPLICKHCQMKFTRWRGFKLHVQLTHLKRLGFLCPYCDRSTNSETLMRQHIRSKHPGSAEQIVHNPTAGGPELTNEFWEKEYGLICPRRTKKAKRKLNVENDSGKKDNGGDGADAGISGNRTDTQETCGTCGFTAMSYTGLKSHMRSHIPKHNIKCPYCTYSCSVKAELMEHWEVNHPSMPFKIPDVAAAETSNKSSPRKKRSIDIYKDDIEEEHMISLDDTIPPTVTVYSCSYCNLRSHSLMYIKHHWNIMHKDSKTGNISNAATSLPFRYKEQRLPWKRATKDQTKKESAVESSRDLTKQLENDLLRSDNASDMSVVQFRGWVCQWCQEFCATGNDMKAHQNMFHSHLRPNFKMQKQQQQEEDQPKEYVCSVCSYATVSIASMRKHIIKHIDLFKCKYCDQTFSTPVRVSAHSAEKHPGLATKIESISNFDSVVENLMNQIKRSSTASGSLTVKNEPNRVRGVDARVPSGHAVARKSTTKSVISYVKPGPRAFKAVARKSTNPLPRYLRESAKHDSAGQQRIVKREPEEIESKPMSSYYGIPSEPVNLAKLSTYMVVGGHSMKVNCTTLAQLININPKVILQDMRYDSKYTTIFSKHN